MNLLHCYCDHCINNTCMASDGVCWAKLTLNSFGTIQKQFNCYHHKNRLIQNLICDQTINKTSREILKCCSSKDYCNKDDNFLPANDEAKRILLSLPIPASLDQPLNFNNINNTDSANSIFGAYSNIPLEVKLVFIILSGLLLVFALATVQNRISSSRRTRRPQASSSSRHGHGDEDYSENSSGKVNSDAAVFDTNSMASREPLISINCNNNPNVNSPPMFQSLHHPHLLRGPYMADESLNGKALSTFQMSIGSGNIVNKLETSTGSGAGQPYLTQRSIAHDIELLEIVGRGYYGVVWRGEYKGEPVAVKIFSAMAEPSWEREAEIYQTTLLRHKNILGFIATDRRDDVSMTGYWLVTDFYPMGSLYDFLKNNSMSMPDAMRMAFSIANGLAHLHIEIFGTQGKPAIAHRDLKSKNILVKNDGTCCIADLGMAVRYNSSTGIVDVPANTRVGTRRYLAPELLENRLNLMDFEAVKSTDVYSLGLVLWELLRRTCYEQGGSIVSECDPYEAPYYEFVSIDPTTEEMREVVCVQKVRPPLSLRWTEVAPMRDYSTLMRECWYEKPQSRLSALRIRKTLGDIARHYLKLNMEYD